MEQADYENKYVIMTQEILGSKDLTPVEKMVLARITGFKIFFESNEATAEFLGVNPDTVKKAKQKLEKLGYILAISNNGHGKKYAFSLERIATCRGKSPRQTGEITPQRIK